MAASCHTIRAVRELVVDLSVRRDATTAIRVRIDPQGQLPAFHELEYDVCLTAASAPPRPWVHVSEPAAAAEALGARIRAHAGAAGALVALLRDDGTRDARLDRESRAYSRRLASSSFRDWLASPRRLPRSPPAPEPVRYVRAGDDVTLWLTDPGRRNAYSRAMRDALAYALDACLADPSAGAVTLRGEGACFSSGGALDEFGIAADLDAAHEARLAQSAVRRLWALGTRARALIHGTVVGAGIEFAAAAEWLAALHGTTIWLPELSMGLVPGAGGTVTIPDRIGRHRATYLLLSGAVLSLEDALAWGLINAVAEAS